MRGDIKPTMVSQIIELHARVKYEQQLEIKRALMFRKSDPIKSAYHTGLADGRQGIATALQTILGKAGERKGE